MIAACIRTIIKRRETHHHKEPSQAHLHPQYMNQDKMKKRRVHHLCASKLLIFTTHLAGYHEETVDARVMTGCKLMEQEVNIINIPDSRVRN